jgi:PiT family inorganic phosphate transporter
MDPAQGFAAQGTGAAVILSASHVGFPLSTTQVMTGAIIGAGAAKRLVRGALGRRPATSRSPGCSRLPASAAVGGLTYALVAAFGTHTAARRGLVILVSLLTAALVRRVVSGRTLTAEG